MATANTNEVSASDAANVDMATILLYGHPCTMTFDEAIGELWSRGLDFDHVVEGITIAEYHAGMKEWDNRLEAEYAHTQPEQVEYEIDTNWTPGCRLFYVGLRPKQK